jgi:hypothetical protein
MSKALSCFAVFLVTGLAACSSSPRLPTTKVGPFPDGSFSSPDTIVTQLRDQCPTDSGRIRLDMRQGDVHLRPVFECSSVRDNAAGAEAELVALVQDRHDAAHRADRVNTVAAALGIKGYGRDALIWSIGIGIDGCFRVADATFHAQEMDSALHSSTHETPLHWTKVEAARFVGTCPEQLDAFLDSVTTAGRPAAATAVRNTLVRLNVLSAR